MAIVQNQMEKTTEKCTKAGPLYGLIIRPVGVNRGTLDFENPLFTSTAVRCFI